MDQNLSRLLKNYIEDLYSELQELPMRVSQKTARAFNFDPRQPLDITFGPDIESYLFQGKQLISAKVANGHYGHLKVTTRNSLAIRFNERFESAALPYLRHRQPVGFDGNQIELRFDPCDPIEVIDSFEQVKAAYNGVAAEMGLRPEFGLSQHWHYSINQGERKLFHDDERLTPLFATSIVSALRVQRACPAFFTYPKRLENPDYAADYNITKLKWGNLDSYSSVQTKKHCGLDVDYATVEPRLGVNDAEQSLALYLSSLSLSLEQSTEAYEVDRALNVDVNDLSGHDAIPVGEGAYMKVLETTVKNEHAKELLPKDIFNALVVDSAQGYIDYLQGVNNVAGRNPDTIQDHIDQSEKIILEHS